MEKDIEKILDFYMKVNKLKYKTKYNMDSSIANKIYNYIILAYAINSEYNETNDVGELIKRVLLKNINNDSESRLIFDYGIESYITIKKIEELEKILSNTLDYYIYTNLKENDIEYLFKKINSNDCMPNNKYKQSYNIFRFYVLNTILNRKERSGWDENHWNINLNRIERVSEHVVGSIALAIGIHEYSDIDVNINKVIETLAIHEIGEILIGDITPFDKVTEEEKKEKEHKAMKEVLGDLNSSEKSYKLLEEFDNQSTKEGRFAYLCDKLEADIQAKVYQDKGVQNSLKRQQNNVVFKSKKVQELIDNGAKTVFDIWYGYDKDKYINDKIFIKTLNYVKNNNLN